MAGGELWAMEFGLNMAEATKEGEGDYDMSAGMAYSRDGGQSWKHWNHYCAIETGPLNRLVFYLFDATYPRTEQGQITLEWAEITSEKSRYAPPEQRAHNPSAAGIGISPGTNFGEPATSAGLDLPDDLPAPRALLSRVGVVHKGQFAITLKVVVVDEDGKKYHFRRDPELVVGGGG